MSEIIKSETLEEKNIMQNPKTVFVLNPNKKLCDFRCTVMVCIIKGLVILLYCGFFETVVFNLSLLICDIWAFFS